MKLIKEIIQLPQIYSVPESAEEDRNRLAQLSLEITNIATESDNKSAREIAVRIRQHLKEVESARTHLTKPLLDAQRLLKALADDHITPLKDELARLERLGTAYLKAEQDRVAAEMKARTELAAEAKTEADFAIVSNEPMPVESRARGQQLRRVLKWEVTDIRALVQSRPDLCKIEAKASAIQAVCVPELPVPGLKLWWEEVSTFTTR